MAVDTTGVIVIALCAAMIVAGIAMIRLSRQQRGMGAIAIVLGVIGVLAWLTAESGAPPPPNATPTRDPISTTAPTEETP